MTKEEKAIKEAFKHIKPGVVYRLHYNNDIEPHIIGKKAKTVYRNGLTITVSDKGNRFITKICICANPECRAEMKSRGLQSIYCKKCKKELDNQKAAEAYHNNKDKPSKKSAIEIAFEITGYYPRIDRPEPELSKEVFSKYPFSEIAAGLLEHSRRVESVNARYFF